MKLWYVQGSTEVDAIFLSEQKPTEIEIEDALEDELSNRSYDKWTVIREPEEISSVPKQFVGSIPYYTSSDVPDHLYDLTAERVLEILQKEKEEERKKAEAEAKQTKLPL